MTEPNLPMETKEAAMKRDRDNEEENNLSPSPNPKEKKAQCPIFEGKKQDEKEGNTKYKEENENFEEEIQDAPIIKRNWTDNFNDINQQDIYEESTIKIPKNKNGNEEMNNDNGKESNDKIKNKGSNDDEDDYGKAGKNYTTERDKQGQNDKRSTQHGQSKDRKETDPDMMDEDKYCLDLHGNGLKTKPRHGRQFLSQYRNKSRCLPSEDKILKDYRHSQLIIDVTKLIVELRCDVLHCRRLAYSVGCGLSGYESLGTGLEYRMV
jgi:hypothetical protein